MAVKIVGGTPLARVSSDLWMLDNIVLNDLRGSGIPLRSFIELYGFPESGKSTLAYYLAGKVAKDGQVCIADLEANANPEYIESAFTQSGFDGEVEFIEYIEKEEPRYHEKILKDLIRKFRDPRVGALILDSISTITPITEKKAEYGEKKIGARAQLVADFGRDAIAWLRTTPRPKIIIGVNHALTPIMGRKSYIAPGGDTKEYLANAVLRMYRVETLEDGTFCSEVRAEKLKYGGQNKNRKGLVACIPDIGVSRELSALYACVALKLATRENTVKIGGKSLGFFQKKFIEGAKKGKTEIFDPFFELLEDLEEEDIELEGETDGTEGV